MTTNFTTEEKETMAVEHEKLVYFIAHQFSDSILDMDELQSTARLGFAKALNTFDKTKGIKFSTYVMKCMHNEILSSLRKERAHLLNNVSLQSIIAKDKHGNDLSLEDTVSHQYKKEANTEEMVFARFDIALLHEALQELPIREQEVLIHRFGLKGQKPKIQNEIGKLNGMSQSHISKLEKIALDELKRILIKKGIYYNS